MKIVPKYEYHLTDDEFRRVKNSCGFIQTYLIGEREKNFNILSNEKQYSANMRANILAELSFVLVEIEERAIYADTHREEYKIPLIKDHNVFVDTLIVNYKQQIGYIREIIKILTTPTTETEES